MFLSLCLEKVGENLQIKYLHCIPSKWFLFATFPNFCVEVFFRSNPNIIENSLLQMCLPTCITFTCYILSELYVRLKKIKIEKNEFIASTNIFFMYKQAFSYIKQSNKNSITYYSIYFCFFNKFNATAFKRIM